MSNLPPPYVITAKKIYHLLQLYSPEETASILHRVKLFQCGAPPAEDDLSTPSPPQVDPTFPQATAILSLLNAVKSAGIATAKCTVNLGGTLVLELQLGPQTEK